MPVSEQSHAFVVKIWHERRDIADAASVWRGSVDDVRGGARVYFNSLATLCTYLARHADLEEYEGASNEETHAPRSH